MFAVEVFRLVTNRIEAGLNIHYLKHLIFWLWLIWQKFVSSGHSIVAVNQHRLTFHITSGFVKVLLGLQFLGQFLKKAFLGLEQIFPTPPPDFFISRSPCWSVGMGWGMSMGYTLIKGTLLLPWSIILSYCYYDWLTYLYCNIELYFYFFILPICFFVLASYIYVFKVTSLFISGNIIPSSSNF